MDIIEMTRELGKALQTDDRYIAYNLAKQVNDEDKELQEQIDSFEKMRYDLNMELTKENKDTDKIKDLDDNIGTSAVMINSEKGLSFFESCGKRLIKQEITIKLLKSIILQMKLSH